MAQNIRVAVRVRPFNQREKELKSKLCIDMKGSQTIIRDTKTGKERPFTFDFSYWSHDKSPNHQFASNQTVYDDLGKIVLDAAFEGYNVSIFAYGQTGSGKSYSMVGYGEDKGIIPKVCEEIFQRVNQNKEEGLTMKVECSMLEIYNERVRDLLNIKATPKGGLKVRWTPKTGAYIPDLKKDPVSSYAEIEALMELGTNARTVAATNMNSTSSRAHTIFSVCFTQTRVNTETMKATDVVSNIALIDLAGSERAGSTGATGARLKEGANINKSLTCLGNCISVLAKKAGLPAKKAKKLHVPFRDSVLTMLLEQSLGGNARTMMVAALSPASVNHDETLSTLRYANRAKQIKNKAVVNEDPNETVIRDLKTQIEELKKLLAGGKTKPRHGDDDDDDSSDDDDDVAELRKQLEENQRYIMQQNKDWATKMAEAEKRVADRQAILAGEAEKRSKIPHILNLHEDQLLAETICYFIDEGTNRLGSRKMDPPPGEHDIELGGLQILPLHAELVRAGADMKVVPQPGARVFLNGTLLKEEAPLKHNDRLLFGAHHFFRVNDPSVESDEKIDFAFAQKELSASMMMSFTSPEQRKEAEEAKKRSQELEAKLAQEREEAEARAKQQEEEFEKKMKERTAELERIRQEKERNISDAAQEKLQAREREMAEQIRKFEEAQAAQRTEQARLQKELQAKADEAKKLQKKHDMEDRDRVLLEECLMKAIPMVSEANAICDELKQTNHFDIKLRTKKSADIDAFTEKTEVLVRVENLDTGIEAEWNYDYFSEQVFGMREIFNDFVESGKLIIPEENPFDVKPGPQLIGNCRLYLQPLGFLLGIDETTPIIDHKGEQNGRLKILIKLIPPETEEEFSDDEDDEPMFECEKLSEMIGDNLDMKIMIPKAMGIPQKLSDQVSCQYMFYLDEEPQITEATKAPSINPKLGYTRDLTLTVTEDLVKHFNTGLVEIEVWGAPPGEKRTKAAPRGSVTSIASSVHSDSKSHHDRQVRKLLRVDSKLSPDDLVQTLQDTVTAKDNLEKEVKELRAAKPAAPLPGQPSDDTEALRKQNEDLKEQLANAKRTIAAATKQGGPDMAAFTKQMEEKDREVAKLKEELAKAKKSQKKSGVCLTM